MKSFSMRAASFAMAAAMVFSLAAVPGTDAQAATKLSLTPEKTSVQVNKTYSYSLKGVTKNQYAKVYKTSGVTVKKGSTTLKNGAKLKGTGKTITLKVKAGDKLIGKKYTLKAKIYNKDKKYVKTVSIKDVKVQNPAKSVALDKTAVELKVGETADLTATMTPANTNSTIKTWTSDKTEVATVDASGKVTAVAAGTATITVTTSNGKTATATVTVANPVVTLADVAQTSSNSFRATFNMDASKEITKDSFAVVTADGTLSLPVKEMKMAADGLSADVTLFNTFTNDTVYKITVKDVTKELSAKVGEVARVVVNTASAQQNVETPISFTLFDANGMDVTPSVNVDTTCIVTVDGTYTGANLAKASKSTITMGTVGEKATVTVTYNSNAKGAEDVVGKQEVTCVDAKETVGTKVFASTDKINNESECAKFYLGLSDKEVSVVENKSKKVYFCAKDDKDDVISYDAYEVESSNDDVASATVSENNKYAVLEVAGNTVGNAQLNIKATKNGKSTYYTIPVVVTKAAVATSMTVEVKYPTMSNVDDTDYKNEITPQLYDAKGNKVDGTFTYELTTKVSDGHGVNGVQEGSKLMVTAAKATAKTYTYKVTGAQADGNGDGRTFVKNVNVVVKALKNYNKDTGKFENLDLTYQIEMNTNTLDENPQKDEKKTLDSRLYATSNGLFAGYVRKESSKITVAEGNVTASASTELDDVSVLAKFGTKYYAPGKISDKGAVSANSIEGVYSVKEFSIGTTGKSSFATVNDKTLSDDDKFYIVEWMANNKSSDLAKTGAWTLEYKLGYQKYLVDGVLPTSKIVTMSNAFTVKNTVVIPTVKVLSRNVDDFDEDLLANLVTNVDMNHNTNEFDSMFCIYEEPNAVYNSNRTKLTLKNVVVWDNYGKAEDDKDILWYFHVPINTTFTLN